MNSLGIDKAPADTRVVVAMSGGVDSSVVAAHLKAEGYQVIGITLQLYDHGAALGKKGACCAGQDIQDARDVAERIQIPHYVLNYESRFREAVMEDFADTYMSGQTPVPCIRCNQSVKFHDLFATAQDLQADALATGHYVRRVMGAGAPELHRAVDTGKDQSYFLFATTREQLAYLRFPLGDLHKPDTRALAARYGLSVQDKPDSQDICFVPQGNYAGVIEKLRPGSIQPGEVRHVDGRLLGHHAGIIHFTVGQRKGLGISADVALYVVRIDVETNQVVVGPQDALLTTRFPLHDVNWLDDAALFGVLEVQVKLRSAQHPVPARVERHGASGWQVTLDTPHASVAPGQACVAYHGERVLGGGWIGKA